MKAIILSIFFTLNIVGNATNWFIDGTSWIEYVNPLVGPDFPPFTAHYTLSYNTNSLQIDCLELRMAREDDPENTPLLAYIKNVDDKIYFQKSKDVDGKWYLMYDFNLRPGEGDTFYAISGNTPPIGSYMKCIDIVDNPQYPQFPIMHFEEHAGVIEEDISSNDYITHAEWIKGIGTDRGILGNIYQETEGGGSKLLKVLNNQELIYDSQKAEVVQKNYTVDTNILVKGTNICIEAPIGSLLEIYSLGGEKIISKKLSVSSWEFKSEKRGMFIVKVNNETHKVII